MRSTQIFGHSSRWVDEEGVGQISIVPIIREAADVHPWVGPARAAVQFPAQTHMPRVIGGIETYTLRCEPLVQIMLPYRALFSIADKYLR